MLAVRAPREKLQGLLPQGLNLCVINSNEACVVGGERADVDAFMPVLKAKGIAFKALPPSPTSSLLADLTVACAAW
jgi:acyl transferase domain-containing protein